jgi:hypothetical protein
MYDYNNFVKFITLKKIMHKVKLFTISNMINKQKVKYISKILK